MAVIKWREDKSFFLIIASLAVAGIVSWSLFFKAYKQQDTVNIHEFPKKIGDWESKELRIEDEEYAILETHNAFSRKYFQPNGKEVYLLIVYSQHNRKVSHPPEICYTGSGATIVSEVPAKIKVEEPAMTIKAKKLLLEQGATQQVSYYWFKVGDIFTTNYWKQQSLIVFKTLQGKPVSSALIRVAATVSEKKHKTSETIEEFARLIVPYLFKYLP